MCCEVSLLVNENGPRLILLRSNFSEGHWEIKLDLDFDGA